MGLDGAFALLVFLGATWYGLLQTLIAISRDDPASAVLIPAAFAHWLVFLYFGLAACVVYGKGCVSLGDEPAWLPTAEGLLLRTWPAALGASAIGFLGTRLVDIVDGKWVMLTFLPLSWFLVRRVHVPFVWAWMCVTAIAFVPYMFLMSQIWSGVKIETDKSEYAPGETVVVTVTSEGYLFNPSIRGIRLLFSDAPQFDSPLGVNKTYVRAALTRFPMDAPKQELARREYVEVVYLPQGSWFEREKYHLITLTF